MNSCPQFHPVNKSSLHQLLNFYKKIDGILKKLDASPIIYGSLAYRYHTKDNSIPIHDIDLLVPEIKFTQIIKELDKRNDLSYKLMPYHSIEIFKDDMKIDIDSVEHFLNPRSRRFEKSTLAGIELNFINKDSLVSIYQEALENMPAEKRLDKKKRWLSKKLGKLSSH